MGARGLSGALLSAEALSRATPGHLAQRSGDESQSAARTRLRAWHRAVLSAVGPASGARTIFDRLAAPLAVHLGYAVSDIHTEADSIHARLLAGDAAVAVLVATAWGEHGAAAWGRAVRHGIQHGVRWCLCVTGPALRIVDAGRAYSRRYAAFDLADTLDDDATFAVFWRVVRAEVLAAGTGEGSLERAIDLSDRHRTDVRRSLEKGVMEALMRLWTAFDAASSRTRRDLTGSVDESLTVIYRILFLLFAEARGLVPRWHRTYGESYTIESLQVPVERRRARGVWETLQAIARLAHSGCTAGVLRVPPFNGRLFSPSYAPLADAAALDERAVQDALLALTTRPVRSGRERIVYADLGVEQLGGVYEQLLDYEPSPSASAPTLVRSTQRKTTGSFYTPRSLTEYVVRRTLAPLVEGATADAILALRVVDPSMGSGAFLVAACRYLAAAYEQAIVRDQGLHPSDVTAHERTGFRRTIAQRCLYGVDINPMAVQLGRLSLWLTTLSGDRPLTFLDHHLRVGNSLVGASVADVMRRVPPGRGRRREPEFPLFDVAGLGRAASDTAAVMRMLAEGPADTLEQVREKERALQRLGGGRAPLATWRAAADIWCAEWFCDPPAGSAALRALLDGIVTGGELLPAHVSGPLIDARRQAAARHRFFHWTLEFPDVFDESGARRGFDAVIGNPPWEMLREDNGTAARQLTAFTRGSGIYRLHGDGHANLYQLFVERGLSLLRRGGRMGIVLPSGFATDHGCAALRAHVLDRTTLDGLTAIENRDGIFPIHRGLRFLLLTLANEGRTANVPLRSGIRALDDLDRIADRGSDPAAVSLPRAFLERASGDQLAVPDIRSARDFDIVSRLTYMFPALGDREGWGVRFGRELNASDDRRHFAENGPGLPVVEGKLVHPFTVDVAGARWRIPARAASNLLHGPATYERARLAYRDVAAASNRLTLIAAIVPRGVVTTHSLFCLKDPLPEREQWFLCGMLNSFVANYLVRTRVTTHVTATIIDRLVVPRPDESSIVQEIARLSLHLSRGTIPEAAARLHALCARAYRLDSLEFEHILGTFPLVPADERSAAAAAFRYIV